MAFFAWLEQTGLAVWVNQGNTVFAYPTVLLFHTIGLTLLVGINLAIDLRLLGFAPQIPVVELRRLFPVMWTGLFLSAVSGVLLLAAKATAMIVNPAFYVKMAAIVLAIAIFFAIRASAFCNPLSDQGPMPTNTRVLALVSILLWFSGITAGRVMAYVGEAAEFGLLILH